MTHKAKRLRAGLYEYRGYQIEDMSVWDTDCKWWNIRHIAEDEAHDAEDTLRQAKSLIDMFKERANR